MRALVTVILAMVWAAGAAAGDVMDATGRTVRVPDHIAHIMPAGPPAAILLEAIAPDLMVGWPSSVPEDARALLSLDAAGLPPIPRVTGRSDVTQDIKALNPDLILDYGTVAPRYADLAQATQQRTGIPTLLFDGALTRIPAVVRTLGHMLQRQDRAETLARFAEALLSLPLPDAHPRIVYARGADGLTVAAPNTDVTEVLPASPGRSWRPTGKAAFVPPASTRSGRLIRTC